MTTGHDKKLRGDRTLKEKTVPAKTEQRTPARSEDTRERESTLVPPVDIFEVKDGLVVVADLPGLEKDAIDVRVENDILTIQGATAKWAVAHTPVYEEHKLANYFRQFELSDAVNQEKIRAEMKHGVLTIHLPKAEEARPKKIEVKVS